VSIFLDDRREEGKISFRGREGGDRRPFDSPSGKRKKKKERRKDQEDSAPVFPPAVKKGGKKESGAKNSHNKEGKGGNREIRCGGERERVLIRSELSSVIRLRDPGREKR